MQYYSAKPTVANLRMSTTTKLTEISIDYPIRKALWWTQNRRGSWKAKWQRTRTVSKEAYIIACNAAHHDPIAFEATRHWQPIHVTATIHPLTHGRFDSENAAPMVKTIIDAMTRAGWWVDDDSTHLIGPDYRAGAPSTDGDYHITITLTRYQQED